MNELREEDVVVERIHVPGQWVNQGPRGVRITHTPSGTVVTSTGEQSRLANTGAALEELQRILGIPSPPKVETWEELHRQRDALASEAFEIDQILGKALGYPYYTEDLGPTDEVCTGDHTPLTLAMEIVSLYEETVRERDDLRDGGQ